MNERFTSNNLENDDATLQNEENDYRILINRLKEISSKIALLEKIHIKNFKS